MLRCTPRDIKTKMKLHEFLSSSFFEIYFLNEKDIDLYFENSFLILRFKDKRIVTNKIRNSLKKNEEIWNTFFSSIEEDLLCSKDNTILSVFKINESLKEEYNEFLKLKNIFNDIRNKYPESFL